MATVMNRALLAWCHEHGGPDNARTAQHWIDWAGEMAFAACTTPADYTAVATAYELSILEIQQC